MTYAIVLLAFLGLFLWFMIGGVTLPAFSLDDFETDSFSARIRDELGKVNETVRASIRGLVRDQLHDAVDSALPEEE